MIYYYNYILSYSNMLVYTAMSQYMFGLHKHDKIFNFFLVSKSPQVVVFEQKLLICPQMIKSG